VLAVLSSIFIYTAIGGANSIIGVIFLLAAIAILVLGGVLVYLRFKPRNKNTTITNRHTMVDSLKRVFKVETAEGHFTEIVDFKDTKQHLTLFRSTKKALIIVKAKVEMGYDFSKIEWDLNEEEGIIKLRKMPKPQITSISPNITYYNLENGLLNKFSTEDFNAVQANCIQQITQVALESDLPSVAAHQAQMLIKELAKMHQWKLEGTQLLD
jgi:hypothetical protein